MSNRTEYAWTDEFPILIGNDLTEQDLADLRAWFVEGVRGTRMSLRWLDKRHQVMLRLILRLTRLESQHPTQPLEEGDLTSDELDNLYGLLFEGAYGGPMASLWGWRPKEVGLRVLNRLTRLEALT